MRAHKTSAGFVVAGIGLLLYCIVPGPAVHRGPANTSAPMASDGDVDLADAGFIETADTKVVLTRSVARLWADVDVPGLACGSAVCSSLDSSQMPGGLSVNADFGAVAFAGGAAGTLPNTAHQGIAGGQGAPGSAANGMPALGGHPSAGPMAGSPPTGHDTPALAPVLLALNEPDPRLEPAPTAVAPGAAAAEPGQPLPATVPATVPAAMPADADASDPDRIGHAPMPSAPGTVEGSVAPPSRVGDKFKVPSGQASPADSPAGLPAREPVAAAAAPDSALAPPSSGDGRTVPHSPPLDNLIPGPAAGPHDILALVDPVQKGLPGIVDRIVVAAPDGGVGSSEPSHHGGPPPAMGDDPVDLRLNGPDRADEVIADAGGSPGDEPGYPYIVPAVDVPAIAITELVATDVPEPSTLALLALAALGLALTGRSRNPTRRHA